MFTTDSEKYDFPIIWKPGDILFAALPSGKFLSYLKLTHHKEVFFYHDCNKSAVPLSG